VKSLRDGRASLGAGLRDVRDGEVWLVGAEISTYEQGNIANHMPTRDRKLLLHRGEIASLYGKVREKGLTLVPTRMYWEGRSREGRDRARSRQADDRQAT
jgi:SsrA-binding protein